MTIKLTKREKEVIELVAAGYNNGEIAQILEISIHTVKKHLEAISIKLESKCRTHSAVLALRKGLID